MSRNTLKKIRVILSIGTLLLLTPVFLNLGDRVPAELFSNIILKLQFIPSLIKFMAAPSVAAAGFILVVVSCLLFGRIYCSTICPLGALMDIISFISRKFNRKRGLSYSPSRSVTRYGILFLTIITFLAGSMSVINLLDPYSSFGRIMVNLVRPVIAAANNTASEIFETFGIYALNPFQLRGFHTDVILLVSLFLFLIAALAIKNGRIYCNTICPLGTLLGIVSGKPLFKIHIDRDNCLVCGKCEKACKTSCIDHASFRVDQTRCVRCFNCISICPNKSAGYSLKKPEARQIKEKPSGNTRREFMMLAGFFPTVMTRRQQKFIITIPNKIPITRKNPVTPPGSTGTLHFTDTCTACHLCISACPGRVLQPAIMEYGTSGLFMPRLNNDFGYCNYQCTRCTQVCPTGAILPLTPEEKKHVQIGKAIFIRDNCIVILQKTACGACAEHCPTKAMHMVPEGALTVPRVNSEICVGCGACEYACPAKPHLAVYVEGNQVHGKAALPEKEKELEDQGPFDFMF